jgi:hypothetical protein
VDDESEPDVAMDESAVEAFEPPSFVSPDFELFVVPVADRSFFAQPEPLKWIAGVLNPFRSVPSAPQLGQNRGAGSWIPWMTSVRCPQLEQT